jgi:hypothetical protein
MGNLSMIHLFPCMLNSCLNLKYNLATIIEY